MAHVAADEGYSATTVGKVVRAAGISRNAFYEHFSNKEDCFLAAFDDGLADALGCMRAAVDREAPRAAQVEAALRALLEHAAAEPEIAHLCVVEVLAAGPRALARRDAALSELAAALDGSRGGDPDGQVPRALTELVIGGVYELVYARILQGAAATLPALLPDIMYVWLAPFTGPRRAAAARSAAATRELEAQCLLPPDAPRAVAART